MIVIIKEPNEKPRLTEIPNTLDSLQAQVGGLIENISELEENNINIWCNEEGKLSKLKPNLWIYEYEDILVGTAVFTGLDPETAGSIDLTAEQIDVINDYITERFIFIS